jgi:23S rRNA A2030 N6-methylase RlmJ
MAPIELCKNKKDDMTIKDGGPAMAQQIFRLQQRVTELEADAARYRWLRENPNNYDVTQKDGYGGRELMGWEYLDAAIDAAREVKP